MSQEPHRRNRRVTYSQLEALWEILNNKRELATGYNKSSQAREQSRQMWMQLAETLNAHGDGAVKDWNGWSKYWADYKSKIKAKVAELKASQRRTGGGPAEKKPLSDIEKKFLLILGEDYGSGLPGVRIEPFEPHQQPVSDSIHAQTESSQSQPVTDYAQPGTSRSQPVTDYSQPGSSRSQPVTDYSQPGSSRSRPVTDYDQLGTFQFQPVTDYAQLGTSRLQPVTDYAQPPTQTDSNPLSALDSPTIRQVSQLQSMQTDSTPLSIFDLGTYSRHPPQTDHSEQSPRSTTRTPPQNRPRSVRAHIRSPRVQQRSPQVQQRSPQVQQRSPRRRQRVPALTQELARRKLVATSQERLEISKQRLEISKKK